jgi:hypothetical protein
MVFIQISPRVVHAFTILYVLFTLGTFLLILIDISFVYFFLFLVAHYYLSRSLVSRAAGIIITLLYLISSVLLGVQLDPLKALQQLIFQGSISTFIEMYLLMGTAVILGLIYGMIVNRPRLDYTLFIILALSIGVMVSDIIVGVITSNLIQYGLFYTACYFVLFSLEFYFWFVLVYYLKQYFVVELTEQETQVELKLA